MSLDPDQHPNAFARFSCVLDWRGSATALVASTLAPLRSKCPPASKGKPTEGANGKAQLHEHCAHAHLLHLQLDLDVDALIEFSESGNSITLVGITCIYRVMRGALVEGAA